MPNPASGSADKVNAALPKHRLLYYAGAWQEPLGGYSQTLNPATGESLGQAAEANAQDVDKAVRAAHQAFLEWRRWKPRDRGALLKKVAAALRAHAEELALLDAANCGNPVKAMIRDGYDGPDYIDFFAGLATEAKGDVTPMGEDIVNLTVQEPYGVCARIVAYNHPLHVRRDEDRRAARDGQYGDHQAAAAGAAVGVSDVRDHRRHPAAGSSESPERRRANAARR